MHKEENRKSAVRRRGLVVAVTIVCATVPGTGPRPAAGQEFVVAGGSGVFNSFPSVASAPDGTSLVVYKSLLGHPSDSHAILGRLFDSNGTALGGEMLINTYTTGGQENPEVTVDGNGVFTVVWDCNGSGDIRGQRIGSNGSTVGTEFVVNTYTSGGPRDLPRIDASDAGAFVVAWSDNAVGGDSDASVQARRYDSSGAPLGNQFTVNLANTAFSQERPDVGVHPISGDFVIAWESSEPLANDDIRVGRFASDGTPQGSELIANTGTSGFQNWPEVEVDGTGRFFVAWNGPTTADFDNGIGFRRFASDGTPQTAELLINSYTTGQQQEPALAIRTDGRVLLHWQSGPAGLSDNDGSGIMGRFYGASGNPGGEYQVNSTVVGDQRWADVAWDHRGRTLSVWGSDSAIYARRFDTASSFFPTNADIPGTVVGARSLGDWNDVNLYVPSGTGTMTVTLDNLDADADLYVRQVGRPDGAVFDCRSNAGGTATEVCVVSSPIPALWWISVANWTTGAVSYTLRVDVVDDPSLIFRDGFESGDTSAW